MIGWQEGGSYAGQPEDAGQDLEARIKVLENWVCTLLIKNQTLRMELQPNAVTDERYE